MDIYQISNEGAVNSRIYASRIKLLYRESNTLAMAGLIVTGCILYPMYLFEPGSMPILWIVSVAMVAFLRFVSGKAYNAAQPAHQYTVYWHSLFMAITFWSSLNWMAAGTFLLSDHIVYQLLVGFIITVGAMVMLPRFASCRLTAVMFLLISLTGFGIEMLLLEDKTHQFVGALTFLFMGASLLTIQQIYRRRCMRIRLKIEKNDLITKLSNAYKQIEMVNEGLREEIVRKSTVENLLRISEEQYRIVTNALPVLIAYIGSDNRFKFNNIFYEKWFGKPLADISGKLASDILGVESFKEHNSHLGELKQGKSVLYESTMFVQAGEERYVSVNLIPDLVNGELKGIFSLISDMTPRMNYLSTHDPLTNLPNRNLFNTRLSHMTDCVRSGRQKLLLMFLDLDHFKNVNDTLGHDVGDQLLIMVVERIKHCIQKNDMVARLGGDEFTIILEDTSDLSRVTLVAKDICQSIEKIFHIADRNIYVTMSIGISVYPDDASDAQTLLKNADMAMYRAKERGRNTFEFYTENMQKIVQRKMTIENGLRGALERDELKIHYQPFIDAKRNRISGFEALSRWSNPTLGAVSPTEFIPVAVERGMISAIGEWVLRNACKQVAVWQKMGLHHLYVSVNLSSRQFLQSDFIEMVARILNETGLEGKYLVLELTENLIMGDVEYSIKMVRALKGLDITISLDDFGTGYASMSYLKRFPFDIIKIDRQFMTDFSLHHDDAAIVRSIITLAHHLNMKVIAEGVEKAEQFEFLMTHGCDEFQGHLFYPALPEIEVEAVLRYPISFSQIDRCYS